MSDPRFEYDPLPNWRGGTKQILNGSEFIVLENSNQFTDGTSPHQVDLDIEVKRPVIFDTMTRFVVEGVFESRAATVNSVWAKCVEADYENVLVSPNWFETLVRSVELFHGTYVVKCHDEPFYSAGYLNMCLYWQMDTALKKLLCAEECHTGNAVPTKKGGWSLTADSDWHKYSKHIFNGKKIKFNWSPLFFFPFYQGSNFVYDEVPPRAVPLNLVGKLTARFTFKDDFSSIFRIKEGVTTTYRFSLTKFDVAVEEARLNIGEEKKLYSMNKRNLLSFAGVTKLCKPENIPQGVFTHTCRFTNVAFPESIFIFAMPRSVTGGTHKYQTPATKFYSDHRIQQVKIEFGGKDFSNTEPNFGTVNSDAVDIKSLFDHVKNGPFGIFTNPEVITRANVSNGFTNTDFPHWYMSLIPSGNRTRLIPLLNDGSAINKNDDLAITLKFTNDAVADNMVYYFYLCYTDVNMTLDLKAKKFESPYFFK
jgi:hypothetical protein